MSAPSYSRNLRDASFVQTKALPAAGAYAATTGMDLGQATVQSLAEIEFELAIPAIAATVDAKVVTFTVKDCDTLGGSYAAVDPAISTTVTGVASSQGSPAKTVRFRLGSNTRRYVQVLASVPADAGTLTGSSFTLSALF